MPSPGTIDPTGVLVIEGKKLFPLGLSKPPPVGKQAPNGKEGLQGVKSGGINFIRTGSGSRIAKWRSISEVACSGGAGADFGA